MSKIKCVGFTGTQEGMTDKQIETLEEVLDSLTGYYVFRHGDCIGSDSLAHKIATKMEFVVHIHPPIESRKRAFCEISQGSDSILHPKPYLVRNRDIVDNSDILIACPKGYEEELRSGTWSTVRYAKTMKKPIIIIFPNGAIERFNEVKI